MSTSRRAALLGFAWLVWIWCVAYAAERVQGAWIGDGNQGWSEELLAQTPPLCRFDSGWYIGIAQGGYGHPPTRVGEQTNHAFFPLYPLLMRLVSRLPGITIPLAGHLISAACLLLFLPLLARYAERHWGRDSALPTVAILLAFPTAFFFAAVYTESLMLLLTLVAVDGVETDRPGRAALAGFLAGLTRVSGLLLAPYLFLLAFSKPRGSRARALAVSLCPVAGFALFSLYFFLKFDDAQLFFHAQHNWDVLEKTVWDGPARILATIRQEGPLRMNPFYAVALLVESPKDGLGYLVGRVPAALEKFYFVLLAVLAALLFRRRRFPETLYAASTLGIILASGTLMSTGRYVLPVFVGFPILASLHRRPRLWPALLAGCLALQAFTTFAFVHWLWAG